MDPIRIDDPHDPRVAAYLDIRERDLAGRQGRFVAEGKVVLDVLALGRTLCGRIGAGAGKPARRPGRHAAQGARRTLPVYVVSSAVMDRDRRLPHASRHPGHRPQASRPQRPDRCWTPCPRRALVVVLVGISNHDNMGSIFRNAAAFGADAVLMDATCCDPLYRKAIRVSVGAALKVPFASFTDTAGFTAMLARTAASNNSRCRRAAQTDIRDAKRGRAPGALSRHRGRRPARKPARPAAHACGSPCRQASTA